MPKIIMGVSRREVADAFAAGVIACHQDERSMHSRRSNATMRTFRHPALKQAFAAGYASVDIAPGYKTALDGSPDWSAEWKREFTL